MFLRLALIHSIFFRNGYISNITPDFYENKFNLVEIIFPKKFPALSPEGSQFKQKLVNYPKPQKCFNVIQMPRPPVTLKPKIQV
jgi:hypothetical protein